MSMKMLLISFVVAVAIAGIFALTIFLKPHRKVENEISIAISSADLCNAYAANEQAANAKYLNKAVAVTGKIKETSNNQDGTLVAVLDGDNPTIVVQCTMRDKGQTLQAGKEVTINGICTSNTMFDILLTDCVIK